MIDRNFSVDEFVGSVIPGVIGLSLLVPVFPKESFLNNVVLHGDFLSGIYIVILGYLLGEGFRVTGGISPINGIMKGINKMLINIRIHEFFSVRKLDLDNWTFEDRMVGLTGEPKTESEAACLMLTKEFLDKHDDPEPSIEDYTKVRRFGESLMSDRNNIYEHYNMMSVFFRSLFIVFLFCGIVYFFHYLSVAHWDYPSIWNLNTPGWYPHFITPVFLLVFTYPCLHQHVRYQQKRTAAFINDFYISMGESDLIQDVPELTLDEETDPVDEETDRESAISKPGD